MLGRRRARDRAGARDISPKGDGPERTGPARRAVLAEGGPSRSSERPIDQCLPRGLPHDCVVSGEGGEDQRLNGTVTTRTSPQGTIKGNQEGQERPPTPSSARNVAKQRRKEKRFGEVFDILNASMIGVGST